MDFLSLCFVSIINNEKVRVGLRFYFNLQMDPGQDLLLAALSESGICPNDLRLLDVDSQDVTQPSTAQQVR